MVSSLQIHSKLQSSLTSLLITMHTHSDGCHKENKKYREVSAQRRRTWNKIKGLVIQIELYGDRTTLLVGSPQMSQESIRHPRLGFPAFE